MGLMLAWTAIEASADADGASGLHPAVEVALLVGLATAFFVIFRNNRRRGEKLEQLRREREAAEEAQSPDSDTEVPPRADA
jgi:hypothetical protein